jgi:hypothetical protein
MESPLVEKITVVRQGKVRRSRLYYLRSLSGKEARRKIKRVERKARQVGEELLQQQPEEEIEPIMDEAAVAAAEAKEAEQTVAEAPEAVEQAKEEAAVEEAVAEPAAEGPSEEAPVAEKEEAVEEPAAPDAEEKQENA